MNASQQGQPDKQKTECSFHFDEDSLLFLPASTPLTIERQFENANQRESADFRLGRKRFHGC
jgi:hypothetical protein